VAAAEHGMPVGKSNTLKAVKKDKRRVTPFGDNDMMKPNIEDDELF